MKDRRRPTSLEDKKFEEERAKRVLQLIFPNKYKSAILHEAPDIITPLNRVGVEVTDSFTTMFHEFSSRVSSISGKQIEELTKIDRRNLERDEIFSSYVEEAGQYLAGFTMWGETYQLETAYIKKVNKLNSSHFIKCAENNLFITAWLISDVELQNGTDAIISAVHSLPQSQMNFDNIYVFAETRMIEIQTNLCNIRHHTISREDMNNISHGAFKEIFGVTRDDYDRK